MENIRACRCANCSDMYDIHDVIKDMPRLEAIEFISKPKTCLRCGKEYVPLDGLYNMDEFVFNAVRTIKM